MTRLRETFNLYARAYALDMRARREKRRKIDEEHGPFIYEPLFHAPKDESNIFELLAAVILFLPLRLLDQVCEPLERALYYRAYEDTFADHAWWRDPEKCIQVCECLRVVRALEKDAQEQEWNDLRSELWSPSEPAIRPTVEEFGREPCLRSLPT